MQLKGFSKTKFEYWAIQFRRTDVENFQWSLLKHYDDMTEEDALQNLVGLQKEHISKFEYRAVQFEYNSATGETTSTFVDDGTRLSSL